MSTRIPQLKAVLESTVPRVRENIAPRLEESIQGIKGKKPARPAKGTRPHGIAARGQPVPHRVAATVRSHEFLATGSSVIENGSASLPRQPPPAEVGVLKAQASYQEASRVVAKTLPELPKELAHEGMPRSLQSSIESNVNVPPQRLLAIGQRSLWGRVNSQFEADITEIQTMLDRMEEANQDLTAAEAKELFVKIKMYEGLLDTERFIVDVGTDREKLDKLLPLDESLDSVYDHLNVVKKHIAEGNSTRARLEYEKLEKRLALIYLCLEVQFKKVESDWSNIINYPQVGWGGVLCTIGAALYACGVNNPAFNYMEEAKGFGFVGGTLLATTAPDYIQSEKFRKLLNRIIHYQRVNIEMRKKLDSLMYN